MKYLKTFENFERQEYTVSDIVKVKFRGKEEIAKISGINTKNSYLIQISQNAAFNPKEYEVNVSDIIEVIKSNSAPALSNDFVTTKHTDASNDLVINGGYPDTPLANGMPY